MLTGDRFISLEDLVERVIGALWCREPFGLARWGDGENYILATGHHAERRRVRYEGNWLSLDCWPAFLDGFRNGVAAADVLGLWPNDEAAEHLIEQHGMALEGKSLVYAWCNRHWNARREWADRVLGRPWRTALIGNRMAEYAGWLAGQFPLNVIFTAPVSDWPDVPLIAAKLQRLRPELVLVSAGWFAPVLVAGGKAAGAVALDYGHCADYHLAGQMLPNTCCPRGAAGCDAHYAHGNYADAIPQERAIRLPRGKVRCES